MKKYKVYGQAVTTKTMIVEANSYDEAEDIASKIGELDSRWEDDKELPYIWEVSDSEKVD